VDIVLDPALRAFPSQREALLALSEQDMAALARKPELARRLCKAVLASSDAALDASGKQRMLTGILHHALSTDDAPLAEAFLDEVLRSSRLSAQDRVMFLGTTLVHRLAQARGHAEVSAALVRAVLKADKDCLPPADRLRILQGEGQHACKYSPWHDLVAETADSKAMHACNETLYARLQLVCGSPHLGISDKCSVVAAPRPGRGLLARSVSVAKTALDCGNAGAAGAIVTAIVASNRPPGEKSLLLKSLGVTARTVIRALSHQDAPAGGEPWRSRILAELDRLGTDSGLGLRELREVALVARRTAQAAPA
jgi:hypothetical protein